MVVFLANRTNLQAKRLHDRIGSRLEATCTDVRRRRATHREPGPYRVVGTVDPRGFLGDDSYPTETARIEIGFQLRPGEPHEYYWITWIEPERKMLVGWHQDDTHNDLGPVHLQVNDGSTAVDHRAADFVDSHPLDVVDRRLAAFAAVVRGVAWEDGRPVELDESE